MTFDPETMTGWDTDFDWAPEPERVGAVEILLRALHLYLALAREFRPKDKDVIKARHDVLIAMSKIDWHAINFAQTSRDSGEDLFSCYPNNDVLVKYTPPSQPDPDQPELAF